MARLRNSKQPQHQLKCLAATATLTLPVQCDADNGAYYMMNYWFPTAAGSAPPTRNETPATLLAAKAIELQRLDVPIQYMQLDDCETLQPLQHDQLARLTE